MRNNANFLSMLYLFKKYWLLWVILLQIRPFIASAQIFNFRKINNSQGLSHSSVFSICQDYKGFMWFGTREGINRFDGKNIKGFYFEATQPNVESNRVNSLLANKKELYVGTGEGVFYFDFERNVFNKLNDAQYYVNTIKRDKHDRILVCTNTGLVIVKEHGVIKHLLKGENVRSIVELKNDVFLILKNNSVQIISIHGEILFNIDLSNLTKSLNFETVYQASDNKIWIGTNQGVYYLDYQNLKIDFAAELGIKDFVRAIAEDENKNLWIGTENGVYQLNPQNNVLVNFGQSFENTPQELSDKSVYSLYASSDGFIWIGTYFGGVNFTNLNKQTFEFINPQSNLKNSLSGKAISQMKEDINRNILVATEDGGLSLLDKNLNFIKSYSKNNGLSDDNTHSLLIESNKIWVGTFQGGLNVIDKNSGSIKHYRNDFNNKTTISNNSVYAILRDFNGSLWIGTQAGLNIFDDKTGSFSLRFPNEIGNKFIYDLLEDSNKNLWIATRYHGIYRYNQRSKNLQNFNTQNNANIANNQIISIYEDSKKNIWFGTLNGGVLCYNLTSNSFLKLPFNDILPNKTIYGILEDAQQNIWFSTNIGLAKFDTKSNKTTFFDQGTGLQNIQFNFKSYLKTSQNLMLFGSVNGLCNFDATDISKNLDNPICHFTNLKLFNQDVPIGGASFLKKHIDETNEIEFENDQNIISLEFVTLNYATNGNNQFIYYLEGFEETWNPKSNQGSVNYTNLSAGNYIFHLKALRQDGTPSSNEKLLKIRVKPPIWLSWYAMFFYILVFGVALYLYDRFIKFINSQKLAIQVEKLERDKNDSINQQKLDLFTYLTNEFKTPITLIHAVIEDITTSESPKKQDLLNYSKILKKNAQHLQILIKKLGTLRAVTTNVEKEFSKNEDIIAFIKECIFALNPIIKPLEINLISRHPQPYLMANFDKERLGIILNNVFFEVFSKLKKNNQVEIITDISNSNDVSNSIFQIRILVDGLDKYDDLISNSGLVNELLKEINGQIKQIITERFEVEILFPVTTHIHQSIDSKNKQPELLKNFWLDEEFYQNDEKLETQKPQLLIVEKNIDFTNFLKKHYQDSFDVITTNSFNRTIEKVKNRLPDIIICDENIVNENKTSVCKELKSNVESSFIPVVLLLENESETNRLKALSYGADLILSKPFKIKELDLILSNTLKSQNQLKERYSGLVESKNQKIGVINNKEYQFLSNFNKIIEKNYKNPNLSIEFLSDSMNCSRSTLHNKIKEITGMSIIEFLNEYRLKLALEALQSGKSVLETSLEVGFNDPNYFGRIFKKKYGKSPKKLF